MILTALSDRANLTGNYDRPSVLSRDAIMRIVAASLKDTLPYHLHTALVYAVEDQDGNVTIFGDDHGLNAS